MVRILRPPTVCIIPEIDEQGLRCGENVWDAVLAHVLVITLAVLVVVAQNTAAIHHQSEPILKAVSAACYRQRQAPHHHFHESVSGNDVALVEQEFSIHVGDNANTSGCCQTLQQMSLLQNSFFSKNENAIPTLDHVSRLRWTLVH
jgi:hypothetical protein